MGTPSRTAAVLARFAAFAVICLPALVAAQDVAKEAPPGAPAAWNAITIRHVLTHTSGIPKFTSFPEFRALLRLRSASGVTPARREDARIDTPPSSDL